MQNCEIDISLMKFDIICFNLLYKQSCSMGAFHFMLIHFLCTMPEYRKFQSLVQAQTKNFSF